MSATIILIQVSLLPSNMNSAVMIDHFCISVSGAVLQDLRGSFGEVLQYR